MLLEGIIIFTVLLWLMYKCRGNSTNARYSTLHQMYGGNYGAIVDRFTSMQEVTSALRKAGLESSNLIFGIDYTLSNLTQGEISYGGRSLHHLDGQQKNPYQQVISILGETLEQFDEDNLIPAFGFGDILSKDKTVMSLTPEGYCHGFYSVLTAYNSVTPNINLSGPTSFAPLIYKAVDICKQTLSYHILVIVADGQVSNVTANAIAIVEASSFPLSIIMVGVGDGPWDTMKEFDDRLPQRRFDNFQFVEFNKIISSHSTYKNPQAAFALQALMEIPDQYKALKAMGMIG